MSPTTVLRSPAPWLPLTGAALAAMALAQVVDWLSPLLVGLLLGALVTNLAPTVSRQRIDAITASGAGTLMLRWGILLLGFRLSMDHLAMIGWRGVLIAVTTVAVSLTVTRWLGRRFGLDDDLAHLIAAGVSVCGAAAIATVQDGVRARQQHVAVALALVTALGTLWIAVIPLLARVLGLSDLDAGIWVGASIHEVAQVVAAGSLLGPAALAVAVSVKLTRVLLLAPVHAVAAQAARKHRGLPLTPGRSQAPHSDQPSPRTPLLPWFVAGFLGAVALRSTGLVPDVLLSALDHASTFLLTGAMAGLGLGILARTLWPLPWRAAIVALLGTLTVTVTPLALVLAT